jgi:hypothetical protein
MQALRHLSSKPPQMSLDCKIFVNNWSQMPSIQEVGSKLVEDLR